MAVLDLLIFYKRNLLYGTTFTAMRFKTKFFIQTFPRSREVPFIAPIIVSVAEY